MSFEMDVWGHRACLSLYVRRYVPNYADAEDTVQLTILKALNRRHLYDPERPLLPWLCIIARNHILDMYRKDRTARGFIAQLNTEDWQPAQQNVAVLFDQVMHYIEQNDRTGCMQIVRLMEKGFSQSEIAAELSLSLGTVKTRVRMLRAKLLQHFGALEPHI